MFYMRIYVDDVCIVLELNVDCTSKVLLLLWTVCGFCVHYKQYYEIQEKYMDSTRDCKL